MPDNTANIGPRIELEGEAEYRQSIANCNKSMSVMKSELKAVTAEFDGNANSIEALRAKNDILLKQQSEQEKKLKLLRGALEEANRLYGEESVQVQNWQIKLNNANADMSKLNKQIDNNSRYLKEAENATDKTATSINEFGKKINDTEKKVGVFGDVLKANLLSDAIRDGVRKLGDELGDVIDESIELASSLEEVQNVVDVTFAGNADNINSWSKNLASSFGIAELSGKEFSGTMGSILKSSEFASDEILKMSKTLVELSGDVGSFKNLQVDEMFSKIRSGITGETEPLKALGYNLSVANLEAFALAEGIDKSYSSMSQKEQILLRYNYLLNVTKDAQGDFARTSDSYANQQKINNLLLKNTYTEIGRAILPEITRATKEFNESLSSTDSNVSDLAGSLSKGVVDVFVWLIDNMDIVTSGLKGVAAAFITKKAIEGVTLAVDAYKTLKAATDQATLAQVAFNTAGKANVIGAIASVVIGVSTAVYSYAKSASEAAEETRKLNDESQKLIDKSNETSETIQKNIADRKKSSDNIQAEANATRTLVDSLYDLYEEEGKTNSSKQQMLSLVEQINEAIPDLNLSINDQTGLLSMQRQEVEKLVKARIELSTAEALQGQLTTIALDKYNQEQALNDLLDVQMTKREELEDLTKQRNNYNGGYTSERYGVDQEAAKLTSEINKLNSELENNKDDVKKAEEAIKELGLSYEEALKYIGDHSEINSATNAMDNFLNKYKETLDTQNKAYADGLDDRVDAIEDTYEKSEDALERSQKAEKKVLDKAQKAQLEAVEDASEEELKILEKRHKKKLDLIDEEYLEKMKLVDEDRYNEIKKVQDQINDIDTQSEAEDRARSLREEQEKRSELKLQIETAKTAEDRLKAQEELAEFEEETAKDRLETERKLQKDILEKQKDTINDTYDAKIKSLEDEKKAERDNADKKYENDKIAIADRLEIKKQEISEIQELESTALDDKQKAEKDVVDQQKEYAVKKAKETYDEDLAAFRLNNALKYDEAIANHNDIKRYVSENVIIASGGFSEVQKAFTNTNLWDQDYVFGNSNRLEKNTASIEIDYDRIEDSFVAALKTADFKVILNDKVVGNIIDKRVTNSLK